MKSPNQAILWEIWRLTRTEVVARLVICIVGGLIALLSFAAHAKATGLSTTKDFGAVIALIIMVMPNWIGWVFLTRFNKGRAGYPLPLIYGRPVSTLRILSLQFAYLTAMAAAIYLVSAVLLRLVSGSPFPFLPLAAWIATSTAMMTSIYWSSRSVLVQQVIGGLISGGWLLYAMHRLSMFPGGEAWHEAPGKWPTYFQLTSTDWLCFVLISGISFGITVYSVARQRRGDARAAWTPGSGWPDWIVSLFRVPCPTSSATRAQVWFDLKSRGLPVLSLGLMLAIINPLLFSIANRVDAANPTWAIPIGPIVMLLSFMSILGVIVVGGLNAFGIRWRKGGTYIEATQPYSTVRLANLKVVVRSLCLLAALIVAVGSMWAYLSSFPLLTGDKLFWKMTGQAHILFLHGAEQAYGALASHEKLALFIVAIAGVFAWVATLAVLLPLMTRYPRWGSIAFFSLLSGGLALSLLAIMGRMGSVPMVLVDAVFAAARWVVIVAMVLSTIYLFWNSLAERLLTAGYTFGAIAASVAFGVAWLTVLHLAGLQLADMPVTSAASMLSLLLAPPLLAALVPWTLGRYRHI